MRCCVVALVCAMLAACTAVRSTTAPASTSSAGPSRTAPPDLPAVPAAWQLADPGPEHAIEGYADRVSLHPGDSFRLFVSTTSPSWTVTAFRIGDYPGTGGARI